MWCMVCPWSSGPGEECPGSITPLALQPGLLNIWEPKRVFRGRVVLCLLVFPLIDWLFQWGQEWQIPFSSNVLLIFYEFLRFNSLFIVAAFFLDHLANLRQLVFLYSDLNLSSCISNSGSEEWIFLPVPPIHRRGKEKGRGETLLGVLRDWGKRKRMEVTGWGGWPRKTQPSIQKQTLWLAGVEGPGYHVYSAVSMYIRLLPLHKEKNKVLLLPSFLFIHALSWSTLPFPVLLLCRLLKSYILALSSRPDAFLSLHWIFPHQCPIHTLEHCFSSPTSAIGLGKQNTYLLGHCRG